MNWKKLSKTDPDLQALLDGPIRDYVISSRWYGGKSSRDKAFFADHILPLENGRERYYLLILEILYEEGFVHNYLLPLARLPKDKVKEENGVIHSFKGSNDVLVDAIFHSGFRSLLFRMLKQDKVLRLDGSQIEITRGRALRSFDLPTRIKSKVLGLEQSNTSIVYEDRFFLKIYRRLFRDNNPDIEVAHFLSEKAGFKHIPAFAASLTWKRPGIYEISLGMMQEKVENEGDAWTWMMDQLEEPFAAMLENRSIDIPEITMFDQHPVERVPDVLKNLFHDSFFDQLSLMAKRTAEMHIQISSDPWDKHFSKSEYNSDYTVWLKNRIMYQFQARYALLDNSYGRLTHLAKEYAQYFQSQKTHLRNFIFAFDDGKLSSQRTRIHGDFHLGQLLKTADDFCILDFEGEPESTVHDRKVKQSPLKDVSGMFRSFHYAIYSTIFKMDLDRGDREEMFNLGERVYTWMVSVFLDTYLKQVFRSELNLGYQHEIRYLLEFHLVEKAIYELGYELNARPTWAIIPLRGIHQILESSPSRAFQSKRQS